MTVKLAGSRYPGWVPAVEEDASHSCPDVRAIAAASRNGVIGVDGRLPWSLPEDVEYLHQCVKGGVVIEGRRCYESRGRAFPGAEQTIVLSGRADWRPRDARVCPSMTSALAVAAAAGGPIWIAGGERVYREAFPYCRRLYLTLVDADFDGDTFLPEWRERFPVELSRTASGQGDLRYFFLILSPRDEPKEFPL